MQPIYEVRDYLIEKVRTVNSKNPKANTGAVILQYNKDYETNMEGFVKNALQTIQILFTTSSSSNPVGTASLTNVSFKIGREISKELGRELTWLNQIRLGDLFVEAFYQCGFADIYYPKTRNTSYIISATARWVELADIPGMFSRINLLHTSITPPRNINGMMQKSGAVFFPVIKGKTAKDFLELDKPYIRSINKLQNSGWRINRRVLDVIEKYKEVFSSSIPFKDNDAKELKRRSQALEWSFIIAKANILKDEDIFYQYLDADYRGRLYYKEPFLNYQGSDISRGMLKFARAKPMTQEGLYWLAVHTATSYNASFSIDKIPEWCESDYESYLKEEGLDDISVDKMTLDDRVRWVNENMDAIVNLGTDGEIDSEAEKIVTFLACCIEWSDYTKAVKDKRIHMSNLPIPIDGSNNGWQHLGAISKDTQTGDLVGLIPREIQKDFYVQTAKELINLTDDERLISILNMMPMKSIRKGITKRGSMTRAYSAGAKKIAENMFFDCKAEDYHTEYGITQDDCNKFAKVLIKAINNVCPGPLQTMSYLQELAKYELGTFKKVDEDGKIAGPEYKEAVKRRSELFKTKDITDEEIDELNELVKFTSKYKSILVYGNGADRVKWTTPSGFSVEYTKFRMERKKGRGTIAGFKKNSGGHQGINHVAQTATIYPDIQGFLCGISPNVIHSLDASHMALVIDQWHGEFGAVHDSFSTHACDVEHLIGITKRAFIDMYDVDNFYNWLEQELISEDHEGLEVQQPQLGTLDVNDIQESDYFFA
jgi:DNA-directed RNA polymerase